ncbi:hypothetical protein chiPu_0031192 [Chiloscyllium punctatum]|uniref:Uncharacterized protein n=1 Tax=Chiloscyllium punctatum TaxID=137246 RepID=A0A401TX35_CHIPU|nr:hypothetical protein [Chiloscyllium punctatum]
MTGEIQRRFERQNEEARLAKATPRTGETIHRPRRAQRPLTADAKRREDEARQQRANSDPASGTSCPEGSEPRLDRPASRGPTRSSTLPGLSPGGLQGIHTNTEV